MGGSVGWVGFFVCGFGGYFFSGVFGVLCVHMFWVFYAAGSYWENSLKLRCLRGVFTDF